MTDASEGISPSHPIPVMKTILAAAAAILALAASAQAAPDWVQSSQQAQAAIQECQKHLTPYVSRGAVDGRISAITHPKTLSVSSDFTYCSESQVRLFCMNGSCGVFFNSKKYGYDPTRCSRVRIGSRTWGWCGDQPASIAMEMWPHLKEGVEVATELAVWPSGTTNFREVLSNVQASKVATYNASLGL